MPPSPVPGNRNRPDRTRLHHRMSRAPRQAGCKPAATDPTTGSPQRTPPGPGCRTRENRAHAPPYAAAPVKTTLALFPEGWPRRAALSQALPAAEIDHHRLEGRRIALPPPGILIQGTARSSRPSGIPQVQWRSESSAIVSEELTMVTP